MESYMLCCHISSRNIYLKRVYVKGQTETLNIPPLCLCMCILGLHLVVLAFKGMFSLLLADASADDHWTKAKCFQTQENRLGWAGALCFSAERMIKDDDALLAPCLHLTHISTLEDRLRLMQKNIKVIVL